MLTIFNRQELTITYDMSRQAEVRELLAQNGINYSVRVINSKSPSPFAAGSRASAGTLGENLHLEYEYIIYVHKSDFNKAVAIINRRSHL